MTDVARHSRGRPGSRLALSVLAVVAAAVVLGGIGLAVFRLAGGSTPADVQLSVFWWGGDARASITDRVLALYTQRHPNVTFTKQWQGNSGYYDKLTQMSTSGTAPDLFQLDDNMLSDAASRGITLNLSRYVGHQIKQDAFPSALRRAGEVNGRVAGIVAADNTPAMVYDRTLVQQLGISAPTVGMSWDALVSWAAQVYQRSGGRVYGSMNPSGDYKAFQVWLRQRGKDLYVNGKLGFAQSDVAQWFQLWAEAQSQHATPPADIVHAANAGDVSKQLVETKQGAASFVWSNQMEELQKGTDHELGMAPYPGDPSGQWLRPSMYWAVANRSTHPDVVADVINFLVNDPDAGRILGAERGLAPNLDVRRRVSPSLTPAMQTSVEFEASLSTKFGTTPPPPPAGHSQIRAKLMSASESVVYRQATAQQAAEQFFKQATAILNTP